MYYSYEVWFSCKEGFMSVVQEDCNIISRLKWKLLRLEKGYYE